MEEGGREEEVLKEFKKEDIVINGEVEGKEEE